jgi:microcystin-dependent protein
MAYDFPTNPIDNQVFQDFTYKAADQVWRKTEPTYGGLPCGAIIPWAGAVAPANWLLCDGAEVSRTTYASLFGLVGTTYGAGNGTTTFNVPDLRGRIPVGKNGGSFGTLGAKGGVESVALTTNEMPSHTHIQDAHNHTHRQWIFNGASASGYHYGFGYSTGGAANDMGAAQGSGEVWYGNFPTTATNQYTGGGQAHTNLQPYQVVNYIIKTTIAATPGDSEFAPRVTTAEAKITTAETKISALEAYTNTVKSSYASRNVYVQVDTAGRSAGTGWTLGPTFSALSFKANSKLKMSYSVPVRKTGGGWGGGYIEPQVSFNGGTWLSLGSTGHDAGVMILNVEAILTYRNELLIAPGITSDFTAAFRFYFRSYDGTLGWNNGINHDINVVSGTASIMSGDNGNQHYMHIIVEEFATG